MFGTDVTAAIAEIRLAIDEILSAQSMLRLLIPAWIPTSSNRRMQQAHQRLDAIIYQFIREHRAADQQHDDLLAMLLHAQDEDGSQMTDQ